MGAVQTTTGEPFHIVKIWNGSPKEATPDLFDYWKWTRFSFCLDVDREVFFNAKSAAFAKMICKNCPVKKHCLVQGLIYDEEGVWGGTTEVQRKEDFEKSYIQALIDKAKQFKMWSERLTAKEVIQILRA